MVEPGDVLGVQYSSSALNSVISYEDSRYNACCSSVPHTLLSRVWSDPANDDGLPVGSIIPFEEELYFRLPAIRAYLVKGNF